VRRRTLVCVGVAVFFFRGRRRRTCGGDEEEETQPTRLYGVVEPWRMFAFNRLAFDASLPRWLFSAPRDRASLFLFLTLAPPKNY
jgi:hypothetical protein